MEERLSLTLSGAAHDHGGAWTITVGMKHSGNVVCTATKQFLLPVGADTIEPWNWAQEILHAVVNELDCLCDVTMTHGKGCDLEATGV